MMNVAEVLLAQRELKVGGAGFAAMVAVFGVGAVLGSLAARRSDTLGAAQARLRRRARLVGVGLLGSALAPSLRAGRSSRSSSPASATRSR